MNNYLNYLPEILNQYEEKSILNQPNKRCITGLRNYTLMLQDIKFSSRSYILGHDLQQ